MLKPAQHVLPAAQHVEPCVTDAAWQHVEPASQQKAELLAPGPNSPQHVWEAAHVAAPLKCVQHLSPELFGMHRGASPPAPQQSSSAVHVGPAVVAEGQLDGTPVVVGPAVVVGPGAVDDPATQRLKPTSHTSSDPQHTPMLKPAQHVLPAGQHVDSPPCVTDAAWQHVEPASQQKAELLAPGPNSPQHVCEAAHVAAQR
jgi:hypothetical protein